MPEGDTVLRAAQALHTAFAGRVLRLSDLRWPSLATADLTGMTTVEVRAAGKHVLHRLDSGLTLHSHLRMDGAWRVVPPARVPSARRDPMMRAVLATDETAGTGRRLGMLDLVRTRDESTLVGHLGPDVLGESWDPERVVDALVADERPVGAALLDQRVLAGVGTFWDSEALFVERVPPWQPAASLGRKRVESLVRQLYFLMERGARHAIQSSTGITRKGANCRVHSRSGRPCVRCGGPIRVAMIGEAPQERTMFYCPRCQGGLGPTDDGKRQSPLGSSRPSGPRR